MAYFGSLNDFSDKNINIKGRINAEYSGAKGNKIKISFTDENTEYKSAVAFAVLDAKNRFLWYSPAQITEDSYELEIKDLDFLAVNEIPARFKLYVVFESDEEYTFSRLYSRAIKEKYRVTKDKSLLYYETVSSVKSEGRIIDFIVNITTSGFFGFILMKKSSRLNFLMTIYVDDFEIENDEYIFSLRMKKVDAATKYGLTLKSRIEEEKYYDVDAASVQDMGEEYILNYRVDRKLFTLDLPDILNFCSFYEIDGFRYIVGVRTVDKALSERIQQLAIKDNQTLGLNLMDLTVRSPQERVQFPTILPHDGVKITGENTAKRILFSPDFIPTRVMFGDHRVNEDGKYVIKFFANVKDIKDVSVFVRNKQRQEKIIVDVLEFTPETGELVIDLSAMSESLIDFTARSYRVCVAFSYKGYMYCATIKSPEYTGEEEEDESSDVSQRYLDVVASFNVDDSVVVLTPMYDVHGFFNIRVNDRMISRKNLVSVNYEKLYFKKNYLYIDVDVTNNKENFTGFALSYRYKKSEDKRVYFQKGELVAKGSRTILKARFDLSGLELSRIIWDLFAVYVEDDIPYFATIYLSDKQIEKYLFNVRNFFHENFYNIDTQEGKDVFFPFFTTINSLAFIVREKNQYDSRSFQYKEFLAMVIYKMFKSHYHKKKIIICYEKYTSCAQDNSYYFFTHCMEHNIEKRLNAKIYYAIDKKAKDYEKLKKYDSNVIDFMSLKHMIYILASRLLVSSDSRTHCYTWRPNNSCIARFLKDKKLFFLQHGVTALKKVDYIYAKEKTQPVNMFVTTSKEEKKIVEKYFGYTSDEICITGFTRWDVLKDKSKDRNEILLMPTWRSWIDEAEDSTFVESDYYKNYMALLTSPRLHKMLEENNLVFNFYIHPKFMNYIDNFNVTSDRIVIIPYGEEQLNELMMRCKLLITDYSSVCWDVFYMGKPVLFYQFDYELYKKVHGSYINMEKELFGDRSLDLETLLNDLEKSIKKNFKLPYEYKLMRDNSFAYIDDKNCARTIQEIRKMKW